MKKLIKWMTIFSVFFCLLGIGIITAGAMMGGSHYLGQALREADRWDCDYEEWTDEFPQAKRGTDVTETIVFWEEETAEPGDTELPLKAASQYEDIRKLEAEITGTVFFQESAELEDGQVRIAIGDDGEDYEYKQEGDTLKIDGSLRNWRKNENFHNTITILVPVGCYLEKADIEVNAGEFQAEILRARELSVEVKAGMAAVRHGEADDLELEVDAGQIICQADVAKKVSADSDLGEILLTLKGKKKDFNYELECQAGRIVLEDDQPAEYLGLHHKEVLDNSAGKKAELECSAGNIVVSYREEESDTP